ncbi:tripartite tricarboxylate transporter permease [Blastococcus deserti]|uniref:Tripartite tricarboxylate transporter permease n=1 Tax=Blastococcus deserti TaxID=2259033 RepID=A0ABW4XIH8_9ACTN
MGALTDLAGGFATALTPTNLMFALLGVLLGTAIGVLPGIGPAMTVALLLPLTRSLDVTSAIIMFAGIYYGGMYGGSTTSILLNTPGESASVVTAIEGNKMARAGRAAQALATAAIGSFVAGTIATLLLALVAPTVADLAVEVSPADTFAIMVLAFIAVTSVLGSSRVRGLAALGLGLTIGLIGIDRTSGQQRLTFGIPQLADGIDVIVVAVGLFAVGEALWTAAHLRRRPIDVIPVGNPRMSGEDWRRSWKPWLRGTAIGFPFGAVPAGGAEIPTFLSYVTEKRLSKKPEEFGKGAIEGVAGPEATNNASAAGGLVPLLTLGIPTTATAAVMLYAIQSYGIEPGPRLFETEPELVWGLIASLFIGNTALLLLNLPLAPLWARLLRIPRSYLYAGILFFASLGAYAANASSFDLILLLVIGALGFTMRRYGLPLLPAIIGVILGPYAEEELRQALQISNGQLDGLVTPMSTIVYVIVALVLLWPLVRLALPRKAAVPVLAEAVHEIEEAHHHTGLTTAVSVERHVGDHVGDPAGRKPDSGEPSGP